MGAPVRIDYLCNHCKAPNIVTYADLPRINEDRITLVNTVWSSDDDSFIRVWRCRCTECGHSNMFNESSKDVVRKPLSEDFYYGSFQKDEQGTLVWKGLGE
jgi:hypothetical protein